MKLIQPQKGEVFWNSASFDRFKVFTETPDHRWEVGGDLALGTPIAFASYDSKLKADAKLLKLVEWLTSPQDTRWHWTRWNE